MKNQLQALLASLMAVAGIVVAAQSEDTATAADYSVFTPWGDPDLQGTWSYASLTPLQRPLRLEEKEFYTDAEARRHQCASCPRTAPHAGRSRRL